MPTSDPPLKPWPRDAVMIVAANAGQERREQMEAVHVCRCRDCGAVLHADTFTLRTAEQFPEVVRRGRPVMFFCLACHRSYAPPSHSPGASVTVDHSGGKGQALREQAGHT